MDGAKLAAADLSPHRRERHLRQLRNLIQRQERGGRCWCGLSSHGAPACHRPVTGSDPGPILAQTPRTRTARECGAAPRSRSVLCLECGFVVPRRPGSFRRRGFPSQRSRVRGPSSASQKPCVRRTLRLARRGAQADEGPTGYQTLLLAALCPRATAVLAALCSSRPTAAANRSGSLRRPSAIVLRLARVWLTRLWCGLWLSDSSRRTQYR
jgi:hypothetical protein